MAKRYQFQKEFTIQRCTKKPKLDISIRRDESPTTFADSKENNKARCSVKTNNDLWDDDDDEVILLATQAAEADTLPKSVIGGMADITFTDFVPNINTATSTQRPINEIEQKNKYSDMWCDVPDNFNFPELRDLIPENNAVFKVPTQCVVPMLENTENCKLAYTSSGTEARRQMATDRQIQFLIQRVDALKKENGKLSTEVDEFKSKAIVKDGETTMLRDELRHAKQQIQSLKMSKVVQDDSARKINELNKTIAIKESSLKLQKFECMQLKMKHAVEVKKNQTLMNMTMDLGEDVIVDENAASSSRNEFKGVPSNRNRIMRLRGLDIENLINQSNHYDEISHLVFEIGSKRETCSNQRRNVFQLELECIQNILSKLQLFKQQQNGILTKSQIENFTQNSIQSICIVFPEMWSYVHSLEYPKNCQIYSDISNKSKFDSVEGKRENIHQPFELHNEERAITLRRYIAAISVLCQQMPPSYSHKLLAHRTGEYVLLQIPIDAITQLGYSREISEHFGLLESFALLLNILLHNFNASNEKEDILENNNSGVELLVSMLKQLIFTRPNAWIFKEISNCILSCVEIPNALSLFCVNSDSATFESDRVRFMYRFSNDSCLLQVYSGLLEIAFPLYTPLTSQRFDLLTQICQNHIRFVYKCFAKPPMFIHKLLPFYDDQDEDVENMETDCCTNVTYDSTLTIASINIPNAATGSNTVTGKPPTDSVTCQCYTKLCLCVVTLLFQVLCEWIRLKKCVGTARVSDISKIAVQLLHIIFCDNYIIRLFRDAEETTKYYLILICKWLTESADELKFNKVQLNFLNKLQTSYMIAPPIEDNSASNVNKDLTDWYRLVQNEAGDEKEKHNNVRRNPKDSVQLLNLIETASDPNHFFNDLNGYAFNFE